MRSKENLFEKLRQDERFQKIALPVNERADLELRDAEFLLRKDGLIVNIEGWHHPPGLLIGEVLYVPDEEGDKNILGLSYRKVTLIKGTHEVVPYDKRAGVLRAIDPELDQVETNPYFARYKQIFPLVDFIAHFPSKRALKVALTEFVKPGDQIIRDLENLRSLLGISTEEIALGFTGAPLLGNIRGYHDLDIVFMGSLEQNRALANKMREILLFEKERRLFEGGKSWTIRFFSDYQSLMCTFFGYRDREDAPLRNFEMEVLQEKVCVEGTVKDDSHAIYTPSILQLGDISLTTPGAKIIPLEINELPLIIYHTASRGECFTGDRVKGNGALVRILKKDKEYLAVCVIEREGVRNLTPPWRGYYGENIN